MRRSATVLLFAAASLLNSCGKEASPWRITSDKTESFWSNPQLQLWLSDNVPREAVDLALRVERVATDSTAGYLAPIALFQNPPCSQPRWSLSSRPLATGSFPAYQISVGLECPGYTIGWSSTITSQLRVVRGHRDSTAHELLE